MTTITQPQVEQATSAELRIARRNALFRNLLVRSKAFMIQQLSDSIKSLDDKQALDISEIVTLAQSFGADAIYKYDADNPAVAYTLRDHPTLARQADLLRDIHDALERSP